MGRPSQFSPEVRERAVRLVLEHQDEHESQWAAIGGIAPKIGCSAETLRKWVRQAERNAGRRPGLATAERERLKQLERENKVVGVNLTCRSARVIVADHPGISPVGVRNGARARTL